LDILLIFADLIDCDGEQTHLLCFLLLESWSSSSSRFSISFQIEVAEENKQRDHVKEKDVCQRYGISLWWKVENVNSLNHIDDKLEHLRLSKIFLPWNADFQRRKEVIWVHQNVNEAILSRREISISSRSVVDNTPPDIERSDVVVHMEKRNLMVILLQNHDEGINELNWLGEIEQPQNFGQRKSTGSRINGISEERKVRRKSTSNGFEAHIAA